MWAKAAMAANSKLWPTWNLLTADTAGGLPMGDITAFGRIRAHLQPLVHLYTNRSRGHFL
jgi:hypothetical protein